MAHGCRHGEAAACIKSIVDLGLATHCANNDTACHHFEGGLLRLPAANRCGDERPERIEAVCEIGRRGLIVHAFQIGTQTAAFHARHQGFGAIKKQNFKTFSQIEPLQCSLGINPISCREIDGGAHGHLRFDHISDELGFADQPFGALKRQAVT